MKIEDYRPAPSVAIPNIATEACGYAKQRDRALHFPQISLDGLDFKILYGINQYTGQHYISDNLIPFPDWEENEYWLESNGCPTDTIEYTDHEAQIVSDNMCQILV